MTGAFCVWYLEDLAFRDRDNNGNVLLIVINEGDLQTCFDFLSDLLSSVVMDKL